MSIVGNGKIHKNMKTKITIVPKLTISITKIKFILKINLDGPQEHQVVKPLGS